MSGIVAGAWLVSGADAAAKLVRRSVVIAVVGVAVSVAALVWLPVPREDAWLGAAGPLLRELSAVEDTTRTSYNTALERKDQGAISDAQLADIIERDVVPPLRKLRGDVAAATVPQDHRALFADLTTYVDDELAAYADLVALSRGDAQAVAMYRQHRDAADAADKAMAAELARLAKE